MLRRLLVENYALIEHLEIEFDSSLNIITGETGAGKSILMGALALLLGAKNDSTTIKDNSRACIVEGEFDIAGLGLEEAFEELDIEYDNETIIRRTISPSGKSRSFVNDQPVQLADLKQLGAYLIDIHSQHQNLILSSPQFRIRAIDTIAGNSELLAEYGNAYTALQEAKHALSELQQAAKRNADEEDWLRHQAEELRGANIRVGEVEEAEQELRTLENADSISEALQHVTQSLDEEVTGVLTTLRESENALRRISDNYASAGELIERLHSAAVELKDISATAMTDLERIEANPERLDAINSRLDLIYTLQRKHRCEGIEELIALRDKYTEQLSAIEHSDELLAEAEAKVAECEAKVTALAVKLHDSRVKASPAFANAVVEILQKVGMADAKFTIAITPCTPTSSGADTVDFLFSANASVEARPIEKIASGGELSRVMLALKTILAQHLALPTIIFDEIDTGISGRTANDVGDIIAYLAESMQVIDITHSPQVASKGSRHFLVYKEQSRTHIKPLATEERIEEIAKMLSGNTITDAALAQAKHLLSL
ncbi:MAG: DNA repair protein RecN [Alistipes sp.]|nr:DNA repair protein RecN [Alistipes sp.]